MGNAETTPQQSVKNRHAPINYQTVRTPLTNSYPALQYNSQQQTQQISVHDQQIRHQQLLMPYIQLLQTQQQTQESQRASLAYNDFQIKQDLQQRQLQQQQYNDQMRRHSTYNVNWELQPLYPKFPSGSTNYEMHNLYNKSKNTSRHSLYSERVPMGSVTSQNTNNTGNYAYTDINANEPSLVLDQFLFLGGHWSLNNPDLLNYFGITHVLNLAAELPVNNLLISRNIRVKHIKAFDTMDYHIRNDFDTSFNFIDRARDSGGKVLVCCVMGVSRSSTIIIGYLMSRYRLPFQSAYNHVRSIRPQIRPNRYFKHQLLNLEQELLYYSYNSMSSGTQSNTERSSRVTSVSSKPSNSESSTNSRTKSKHKPKLFTALKQQNVNKKTVRFRL